jgi:hypothetical protein
MTGEKEEKADGDGRASTERPDSVARDAVALAIKGSTGKPPERRGRRYRAGRRSSPTASSEQE